MEEWKDIRGYEGLYQISNYGRVKKIKDNSIIGRSKRRYKVVKIKGKRFSIGILMLKTWKPIDNEKIYRIKYIDGDNSNLNINNLKWVLKHPKKNKKYKAIKIDYIPSEIWKDIEELDNLYQISNKGRIKSKRTNRLIRLSWNNGFRVTINCSQIYCSLSVLLDKYFPSDEKWEDVIMNINGKYTYEISNKGRVRNKQTKCIIKGNYIRGKNIKKIYQEYFIDNNVEDELWVPTYNFPNHFVSNYGRVKNIHGNFIKPIYDRFKGRYYIRLYHNNKYWTFPRGRLVLLSFYPPSDLNLTCNHIDFNPKNDNLSNLEWMSRADNVKNSQFNDTNLIQRRKKRCKKIKFENIIFNTINDVALYVFGKNDENTRKGIYSCCEKRKLSYFGKEFSYA